jgi:two-component system cell cycle response regulator
MPVILLADDSFVVRAVLREQLMSQGFTVLEAPDGARTLEICRKELPDIVLLDVDMPLRNGHEVLVEMRATEQTKDIPVVFLTGRVDVSDAAEGLRLGAHDYLRKPVEPIELIARVSAALRIKELQDELRRRNAELYRISRTDALTGLHNRRHLDELIGSHDGQPAGVVMLDIDHFKTVNDTRGHGTGDEVLRGVADILAAAMRDHDLVGRWGGEEFLAVLPQATIDATLAVAERMRLAVAQTPIRTSSGPPLTLTVSAGCAAGVGRLDSLIQQADDAMYDAKQAGRNTVRP